MSLRWISFDSLLDIYCHLPWQVSAKGQKVPIPNGAGLIIQLVLWLGQSRAKCPVGQPDTLWLSSVSSQQVKELGLISALLMSLDEVEGCDFFESTFHVLFVFWTSFLPQSRVRASGWRAFFSWTPLRSSWYSVIYVLSLMWGLGRPTPHLFWSHRSDGDSISQSHCLSSHISVLAYPCSVGNIKTPHFLLPIQSHICHFQTQVCKRGWVWGLWCSGSMQTPPWSQGEVSALHGWGGSGASSLYALLLVHWLITLD